MTRFITFILNANLVSDSKLKLGIFRGLVSLCEWNLVQPDWLSGLGGGTRSTKCLLSGVSAKSGFTLLFYMRSKPLLSNRLHEGHVIPCTGSEGLAPDTRKSRGAEPALGFWVGLSPTAPVRQIQWIYKTMFVLSAKKKSLAECLSLVGELWLQEIFI